MTPRSERICSPPDLHHRRHQPPQGGFFFVWRKGRKIRQLRRCFEQALVGDARGSAHPKLVVTTKSASTEREINLMTRGF